MTTGAGARELLRGNGDLSQFRVDDQYLFLDVWGNTEDGYSEQSVYIHLDAREAGMLHLFDYEAPTVTVSQVDVGLCDEIMFGIVQKFREQGLSIDYGLPQHDSNPDIAYVHFPDIYPTANSQEDDSNEAVVLRDECEVECEVEGEVPTLTIDSVTLHVDGGRRTYIPEQFRELDLQTRKGILKSLKEAGWIVGSSTVRTQEILDATIEAYINGISPDQMPPEPLLVILHRGKFEDRLYNWGALHQLFLTRLFEVEGVYKSKRIMLSGSVHSQLVGMKETHATYTHLLTPFQLKVLDKFYSLSSEIPGTGYYLYPDCNELARELETNADNIRAVLLNAYNEIRNNDRPTFADGTVMERGSAVQQLMIMLRDSDFFQRYADVLRPREVEVLQMFAQVDEYGRPPTYQQILESLSPTDVRWGGGQLKMRSLLRLFPAALNRINEHIRAKDDPPDEYLTRTSILERLAVKFGLSKINKVRFGRLMDEAEAEYLAVNTDNDAQLKAGYSYNWTRLRGVFVRRVFSEEGVHIGGKLMKPGTSSDWLRRQGRRAYVETRRGLTEHERQVLDCFFLLCEDDKYPTYDDMCTQLQVRHRHVRNMMHSGVERLKGIMNSSVR